MQLVLIQWKDPCAYALHGWSERESDDDEKMKPINCVTAGILYQEDDERVVVVLNLNPHSFCQAQSISKSAIERMWKLKVDN